MGNNVSNKRKSGKILDQEIAVLKANSGLSEEEIRGMYDEFTAECPSGKMDKTHFDKYYKKACGSDSEAAAMGDQVFSVCDRNHDGTVNFSELVIGIGLANRNDPDSQLDLMFEVLDTSGDGSISFNEMVEFIKLIAKLPDTGNLQNEDPQTLATGIFAMFGVDKSQKLSKQQYIDGCKKNETLKGIFGGGS